MQSLAQILLPLLGAVAGEPPVQPASSAPAQPEAQSIELLAGRSVHIKSAWPVAGASLTDPEVADVNVVMPELVLVSGLASGTTDLVLWSEDGSTQEYRVSVRVDVAGLKASLDAMFPGASLVVE